MWSVRSISADPGTSEANYVSGSCEGRYEESDHGKRIRNISDGTYDLKYLCKTIHRTGAYYIWLFAIAIHIVLIICFTVKFVFKLQMPKVFASYYIVYVGIVVASVTAPAYEKLAIGSAAFWFGFVTLILLLILVTYRYVTVKEVPDPAKPLICIYAAPTSLCIAGYVQSVMPKSYGFLMGMFVVATVIYIFALVKAIGYLKMPFFPSYAAFTFPFVISAIASKQTMACVMNMGHPMPFLKYVVLIETIIAVILVVYTYIRFMGFIFGGKK